MDIPDYEDFQQKVSVSEYSRGRLWEPGDYSDGIEVAEKDRQAYFIKDEETGKGLVMPYVLADTVAEGIGFELEMRYDEEAGKIIRPEIEGTPTDEYVPGVMGFFNRIAGRPVGPEPQELYEASALKYFIADSDVAPNIVVNGENAEPIDFQRAGVTAAHFYGEFLRDLEEVLDHLNREFSQRQFEDVVSGYAEEAGVESIERSLRDGFEEHETFRTERREEAAIRKTIENFERFR